MSSSNQKTIFITGSSTGLGRATVKLFAEKGWQVMATMRSPQKEKELHGHANIRLFELDVANPVQIKQVVEHINTIADIDVVFNNAGYGLSGPLEAITDEQIIRIVNTNLLGTIRVTKAFIPYFRARKKGLFINTTSIGGLISVPFNSIYHATKWALEGWSESMAFELKRFNIGLKAISPGGMKTDFFTRSFDTAKHEAYDADVNNVMSIITDPKQLESFSTPEQIAAVVFEAATDEKDQLRYTAGADAVATVAARQQMGAEEFHKALEKQFFG